MKRERYEPRGVLAVDPRAFGILFNVFVEPEVVTRDGVAIVAIRGPLEHHESLVSDSYAAIKRRVAQALEGSPRAVVLSIDSPGGKVSGCFEASREIREMARAASVPLFAYVDGCATSAAYALACAAERIGIPASGAVGSIGVIDALVDMTAQDAMMGVRIALVTSGARKADGNPHGAMSEDAIAASQGHVDALAETFFAWVAESRGISADEVRKLEAGILLGADAVRMGLADDVITQDALLAIARGAQTGDGTMSGPSASKAYEEAIAALRKAADSDDEKEAKRAKRMLAAELAEGDDDKGDGDGSKAEGDEENQPDEEKKDEEAKAAKSSSVSAKTAGELAAHASSFEKRLEALERQRDGERRDALLASRPDLPPQLAKVLATKPFAEVQSIVSAMPKATPPKPAAAASVQATRGEGQGEHGASRLAPLEKARLDTAMGLTAEAVGVVNTPNKLTLGAPLPTQKGT